MSHVTHDHNLQISARLTHGIGVLSLTGALLAKTRLELENVLRDWLDSGVPLVLVRCGSLRQIDSAGLSALLAVIPRLRRRGGDIALSEVNPSLKALFQVGSMKRYLRMFATTAEAQVYLNSLTLVPADEEAAPVKS